jgi:hypothetical protein
MSRNTLLGQSLVRNANALNFGGDGSDINAKHWKRDWFTPLKSQLQSTVATPSATPTPFGEEATPQIVPKYTFKVKAWVVDDSYVPVVDGDEDDVLDLDEFSTIKAANGSNGLSDADIRGAVATDGDAVPGTSEAPDDTESSTKLEEDEKPELKETDSNISIATEEIEPEKIAAEETATPNTVETSTEAVETESEKITTEKVETPDVKTEEPQLSEKEEEPIKPEEIKTPHQRSVAEPEETQREETQPELPKPQSPTEKDIDGDVVIN